MPCLILYIFSQGVNLVIHRFDLVVCYCKGVICRIDERR